MPDTPPPTLDADDLIHDGLAASRSEQVEAALDLFRRAADRAPQSGVPHFLIGAELAQAGRMDEAECAFANAVLLAPDLDMARYQLGLLQFTANRTALALLTWGPLFHRGPDASLHHVVRGFAALAQDDLAAALSCFREGHALNHDNAPLNKDLQMLMDRIVFQQQAGVLGEVVDGVPVAAATERPVPQAPAEHDENRHVLLANYQPLGRSH